MKIGITERGDAGLDLSWTKWKGPKILITKAPNRLANLNDENFENTVIHCTITGLGGTKWEPNVPPIEETIPAYHRLVDRFGGERVVWRMDPIIIGENSGLLPKFIGELRGRFRISFLDMYPHVTERLAQSKIQVPQAHRSFHASIHDRKCVYGVILDLLTTAGKKTEVEICGEPGLTCSGCVSKRDLRAMGISEEIHSGGFQRRACECAAEKTEILAHRGQCGHRCVYCYWKG